MTVLVYELEHQQLMNYHEVALEDLQAPTVTLHRLVAHTPAEVLVVHHTEVPVAMGAQGGILQSFLDHTRVSAQLEDRPMVQHRSQLSGQLTPVLVMAAVLMATHMVAVQVVRIFHMVAPQVLCRHPIILQDMIDTDIRTL